MASVTWPLLEKSFSLALCSEPVTKEIAIKVKILKKKVYFVRQTQQGEESEKNSLSNSRFPVVATSRHDEVPEFLLHLLLTSALSHCRSGEEVKINH